MSSKLEPCSNVQVIDLGKLGGDPSVEVWRCAGQKLTNAFRDLGYAYVVNHGVPSDAVKKMFTASADFFKLPEDQKNSFASDGYHGYLAVGRQRVGDNYECREVLDIMKESGPLPDDLVPDLRGAWSNLSSLLSALSVQVFRALEYGLGLEENKLVNAHSQSREDPELKPLMRMTHYPPVPSNCPANTVRLAPHTDFGSMTFDIQDEHEGLEVRNREGEWVPATCPEEGAVLVLLGDTMEKWLNGKLRATAHRVTVPKDDRLRQLPRRSLVYFCVPNNDETLAPFDGSPSEMSHVTVKEYIQSKQMKTLQY